MSRLLRELREIVHVFHFRCGIQARPQEDRQPPHVGPQQPADTQQGLHQQDIIYDYIIYNIVILTLLYSVQYVQ